MQSIFKHIFKAPLANAISEALSKSSLSQLTVKTVLKDLPTIKD